MEYHYRILQDLKGIVHLGPEQLHSLNGGLFIALCISHGKFDPCSQDDCHATIAVAASWVVCKLAWVLSGLLILQGS